MPMVSSQTGLEFMLFEMQRQHSDGLLSLEDNLGVAARVAASIVQSKRLVLLGMGASHFANRVAEVVFRAAGVDVFAIPLSEGLYAPLPLGNRTVVIASQSGESGEAKRFLEQFGVMNTFGLTLDKNSSLARAVPCLLGFGGVERGFAATRSLLLTLVLHAAILEALGISQNALRSVLVAPIEIPHLAAVRLLESSRTIIFSGRAELQGLAEVSALHCAELARLPALALEGGQFRHGPLELLETGVAVVLLRATGTSAALTETLVKTCLEAGVQPIVFDASGEAPIVGALNLLFPRAEGLAAAAMLLPTLQNLLLDIAATRVQKVGEPRRSSKITGEY